MLLTNHTLTGVLLGLTIDHPALLAPAAVASHIGMDMLPHFGYAPIKDQFRAPMFLVWGTLDVAASATVVGAACMAWPQRTPQILVGAFGVALPDLIYIPIAFLGKRRIYRLPGYEAMIGFLGRIQWYEKPPGFITEVLWAALMLYLTFVLH
jgi:hypothetical protein